MHDRRSDEGLAAKINLSGQTPEVTCTFTNTTRMENTGTTIIGKAAVNGDGARQFEFNGDVGQFSLLLPGDGTVERVLENVTFGAYAVDKSAVNGWSQVVPH